MTDYKQSTSISIPSYDVRKVKEKRKQQLTAVWERRKVIYERYIQKVQAAHERQHQP